MLIIPFCSYAKVFYKKELRIMESLHYLLMADHFMLQKALIAEIRGTGLTPGQPKVLDYLLTHEGRAQKEIAGGCHIEPATLTRILTGMEKQGYLERRVPEEDRRTSHIYLTDKGRETASRLENIFAGIENHALSGFSPGESQMLCELLSRVYENMSQDQE